MRVIILLWYSSTSKVSQRPVLEKGRCKRLVVPVSLFLATMFHAVRLNVIDPMERMSNVLDMSGKVLSISWIPYSWHQQPGSCTVTDCHNKVWHFLKHRPNLILSNLWEIFGCEGAEQKQWVIQGIHIQTLLCTLHCWQLFIYVKRDRNGRADWCNGYYVFDCMCGQGRSIGSIPCRCNTFFCHLCDHVPLLRCVDLKHRLKLKFSVWLACAFSL